METNMTFDGCRMALGGQAFYDERNYFLFAPDDPAPGRVARVRRMVGVAQQMTDGTFDFVAKPRLRAQSTLIKKLAHGRVSRTKDGAIRLTLMVTPDERVNIAETIAREAGEAKDAVADYQMRGGRP